jgi:anti-sigma factor (TIGR02949 family)
MADAVRSIDCQSALKKLWDYLDEELDDERTAEIRHHLEACEHCFQNAEFGRQILVAVSGARTRHEAPPRLRPQVLATLAQAGFISG